MNGARTSGLMLKVEGMAGANLGDLMVDMLDLARRTGCMVEMKANDITFWVYPDDVEADIRAAFDRLYPTSRYVSTRTRAPVPHTKRGDQ